MRSETVDDATVRQEPRRVAEGLSMAELLYYALVETRIPFGNDKREGRAEGSGRTA